MRSTHCGQLSTSSAWAAGTPSATASAAAAASAATSTAAAAGRGQAATAAAAGSATAAARARRRLAIAGCCGCAGAGGAACCCWARQDTAELRAACRWCWRATIAVARQLSKSYGNPGAWWVKLWDGWWRGRGAIARACCTCFASTSCAAEAAWRSSDHCVRHWANSRIAGSTASSPGAAVRSVCSRWSSSLPQAIPRPGRTIGCGRRWTVSRPGPALVRRSPAACRCRRLPPAHRPPPSACLFTCRHGGPRGV